EDREHVAEEEAPPVPVRGDAPAEHAAAHDPGDEERGVGGERGRRHGRAREPPGQAPPRDEIARDALLPALREPDADREDDRDVEGADRHGARARGATGARPGKPASARIAAAVARCEGGSSLNAQAVNAAPRAWARR